MSPDPAAALAAALAAAFPGGPPDALGIALSGGGDSVALTVLMADWAAPRGVRLAAATVDHGLRPESAAEAAAAGALCAGLGIPHAVLAWEGQGARGNLQDAARRARQRLLGDWAAGAGLAAVALAHTRDDQAETVLMRLARGAGVDGLSAMAPARRLGGVLWLRPLLGVSRAGLRALLRRRGVPWAEDALNADARFARVRTRQVLAALRPLGIDAAGLAATAGRMAAARQVLEAAAAEAAGRLGRIEGGDVTLDAAGFLALPAETRERMLGRVLAWVGGQAHPPRRADLQRLIARAADGRGGTLHGCVLTRGQGRLRIAREAKGVAGLSGPVGALWDGRWRLIAPQGAATARLQVAALGRDGLAACPDWRRAGLPRASLIAGPAVWDGPCLVAAPLAGLPEGWRAETVPPAADFPLLFILH